MNYCNRPDQTDRTTICSERGSARLRGCCCIVGRQLHQGNSTLVTDFHIIGEYLANLGLGANSTSSFLVSLHVLGDPPDGDDETRVSNRKCLTVHPCLTVSLESQIDLLDVTIL